MIHKACMPVYMNSGKIVADGRDGWEIEGSTRGPRGPKKLRAAVEYTTKPGVHQPLQTQLFFSVALAPMQHKLLKLFGPGLQVTNISHF